MPCRDIVVIGASAGGIQAVVQIAKSLPADFPASVFVVIHISPTSPGVLPQLLDNAGELSSDFAQDGEAIRHKHIYVAPPDHHLLIGRGYIALTRGPRENNFRPAVDPMFRTAAESYGPRVIGIVLSGGLNYGTIGLSLIKRAGGVAIVQDPTEAPFDGMPRSAIANVKVDYVLPSESMAALLNRVVREEIDEGEPIRSNASKLRDPAVKGTDLLNTTDPGPPSGLTCPECGGAVWESPQGGIMRYRCHVGHTFTPEALDEGQTRELESALWTALRALEESVSLRRRMAARSEMGEFDAIAKQFHRRADEAARDADLIRGLLQGTMTKAKPQDGRTPGKRTKKRSKAMHPGGNGKASGKKNSRAKA
jgi:two-component system, chemotaxis family, protein-glutamate methylesterase/glutaminase